MRDLIISLICMAVLIVPWGIYSKYSTETTEMYNHIIDNELLPAVTSQNWDKAESDFESVTEMWNKQKKISSFFSSTSAVNDIDSTVKKTYYYLKMKDKSNTSGEAAYLRCKLNYLYNNETLTPSNIL